MLEKKIHKGTKTGEGEDCESKKKIKVTVFGGAHSKEQLVLGEEQEKIAWHVAKTSSKRKKLNPKTSS